MWRKYKTIMEIVQTKVKEAAVEDISAEAVLYDVLDKIFSYFTIKDLCRAATVCKSWQYIANLEISKRSDIESLIWPITHESDVDDFHQDDKNDDSTKSKYSKNRWHISDSMRSLPKLVLLFNDENETELRNIEQFFVYHWSRVKIGTKIGAIHSVAVFMNSTEIVTDTNLGVAITLPFTPKLKLAAYSPNDLELQMHAKNNTIPQLAGQAVNSLISSEDSHNCFIIFKNEGPEIRGDDLLHSRFFLTEFSSSLKQKCKPGTYSIWGGGVPLFITNVNSLGINSFVWFFIVRLSGPAFNSWSIVLKTELSDVEKEEKLIHFKTKLHLKPTHTVALAMASSNRNETSEQRLSKTKIFRKIFPKISLIAIYEEDEFIQLGMNTLDCDTNPQVEHTKSVAYLIMTTK